LFLLSLFFYRFRHSWSTLFLEWSRRMKDVWDNLFCFCIWYGCRDCTLRRPVRSIKSLSAVPISNPRVATVARSEWFVLNPSIPASAHTFLTVEDSVLCPTGVL
jgi:hypothetical protein